MTQIPLYFLPGTQCDEQLWQSVFDLLPPLFSPHAITIPIGTDPDDIVDLLHRQLPNNALNLIGFSLGGYLAALYAMKYQSTINQLLILANAPRQLPEHELKTRQQTLAFVKKHGYKGMPTKRITQLLSPFHHDNNIVIDLISEMDMRGGQTMLMNQLETTSDRIDLLPALVNLSIDIRFVIGEDDSLVDIGQLTDKLTSSHLSLTVLPRCGHMSPLESPRAVANQIIDHFTPQ